MPLIVPYGQPWFGYQFHQCNQANMPSEWDENPLAIPQLDDPTLTRDPEQTYMVDKNSNSLIS